MKLVPLSRLAFFFILALSTVPAAFAQPSSQDLTAYLSQRDQVKTLELDALKKLAANPAEKPMQRGLASYYVFLKTPLPEGDAVAGKKAVDALEAAANDYLDPFSQVKLAQIYARDRPEFGLSQDRNKALKYLAIAWEIADLSEEATGNNALLTLIINNSLGVGDGLWAESVNGKFAFRDSMSASRPGVLAARERFKKLYGLSVKDEFPSSLNVERHYVQTTR